MDALEVTGGLIDATFLFFCMIAFLREPNAASLDLLKTRLPWSTGVIAQSEMLSKRHGRLITRLLLAVFQDALSVMERVERHVLHDEALNIAAFKSSFWSSFSMTAIVARAVLSVLLSSFSPLYRSLLMA